MRRHRLLFPFLALGAAAVLPLIASAAGTSFSGPIISGNAQTCPAGWASVIQTVSNLVQFAIYLGVAICVLMLAYAGFLWVLNPTNPENRSTGRKILINAAIGLVLVLSSWLIVNTILTVIGAGSIGSVTGVLSGGSPCITAGTPGSTGIISGGNGSGGVSASGSTSGIGACTVPSGGPCAPSNLSAFGSAAENASKICNKESGGNPQNLSRSDKTSDGNSYSVGLFQVNLTNSYPIKVDGQNCSAAFSNSCNGSHVVQSGSSAGKCDATVVNDRLYYDCVQSAQNPANSISAAQQLSSDGTNWNRWSTSNDCGLHT